MKNHAIIVIVLISALLSWAEEFPLTGDQGTLKIVVSGNIRKDPLNGSPDVVGRVSVGQVYTYDKFLNGRWYRILTEEGAEKGWIYKTLVKVVEPLAPTWKTPAMPDTALPLIKQAPQSSAVSTVPGKEAPSPAPVAQPEVNSRVSSVGKSEGMAHKDETRTNIEESTFVDSTPQDTASSDALYKSRVTFNAKNTDLVKALTIFAQSNGLILHYEATEQGKVTVSLKDALFSDAMTALLKNHPLTWRLEGDRLVVAQATNLDSSARVSESFASKPASMMVVNKEGKSRIFEINYPRLHRSGSGSNSVSINSSGSGNGNVSLSTTDELVFWQEMEDQLKQVVGTDGKLVINRLGGIIYVTSDKESVLDAVQRYIEAVVSAAVRQVEITARIYEVTLNRDHSLGIDWNSVTSKIASLGQNAATGKVFTNLIETSADFKQATFNVDLAANNNVEAIVQALEEQGTVKTVSQPRVMTLNNQPALVKIGTDYPYFSDNVTFNQTTGQKEVTEQIRTITVGVVLSVTPQISDDGWITLGIDPMISNLVATATSQYGSTAPIIDVKQSSALVRLKDKHTVRISGLLQTGNAHTVRKIPLLGDIPLLGKLFQWNYFQETHKELVIFITPRIL